MQPTSDRGERATVDLVVRSRRVVTPEGERPAAVHVRDGRIAAVAAFDDLPAGAELVEGGDLALLPGLVDSHVHLDEPGRTEWEGFLTGTRAAAAGGVTTVVDMPLNSVPATTSASAFAAKLAAARERVDGAGKLHVDVGFWGGVVPGNSAELAPLVAAGALGFKCFLVPSGVDEFAAVEEADLARALPELARLGVPLLAHAELPGPIAAAEAAVRASGADPHRYATWLAMRPPRAETAAVELLVRLARAHGASIHVVHVAAAEVLPLLAQAQAAGLPVSAETCPHYLTLVAEEIADGDCASKCAPPVRERAHREALWQGLRDGVLALIASDHSPAPPARKELASGDLLRAWGGIASLELALPVVWTGARRRGFALTDLARWMAAAPAALAGIAARKGALAPGRDADLVLLDPEATFTVDARALRQRHAITPYAGRTLRGRVASTWLRGRRIFDGREVVRGHGRVLLGRDSG